MNQKLNSLADVISSLAQDEAADRIASLALIAVTKEGKTATHVFSSQNTRNVLNNTILGLYRTTCPFQHIRTRYYDTHTQVQLHFTSYHSKSDVELWSRVLETGYRKDKPLRVEFWTGTFSYDATGEVDEFSYNRQVALYENGIVTMADPPPE